MIFSNYFSNLYDKNTNECYYGSELDVFFEIPIFYLSTTLFYFQFLFRIYHADSFS